MDTLKDDLEAMIERMDHSVSTYREAITSAAVEAAMLSHAEMMIDRANHVRERLASKLQPAQPALSRYEPVDHGPLVVEDDLDRAISEMQPERMAQRFRPEVRQERPFPMPLTGQDGHPGPSPGNPFGYGRAA